MSEAPVPDLRPQDARDLSPLLLAALEQTRSAACITTSDLDAPGPTIVYVNPAYCAMTGRNRADVIGRSPRIMQGPLTDRAELDRLRADLDAGRPFEGETVNYRADGTPFIINWRIDPVRDEADGITHFVATQQDVTRERRTQRLLDAGARLDDALKTTLTSGSDPEQARQFLVDTIAAEAMRIGVFGQVIVSVSIDGAQSLSSSDSLQGDVLEFPLDRPESGVQGRIVLGDLNPHQRDFIDERGLRQFAERAVSVLGALVEYQRQRRTALRLQQDLLPGSLPSVPGLEVATTYLPGPAGVNVGGDWFDATISSERIVLSVGDVSGNGVDAAALMGRLRLLADVELSREAEVPDMLRLLNDVCRAEDQFATMLVVELAPGSNVGRVWSAGHPPPIHTSEAGASPLTFEPLPPLGHLRPGGLAPAEFELPIGMGLLLFTDGLIERPGESLVAGIARVRDIVDRIVDPGEIISRISQEAAQAPDDVAALAALRTE